VKIELMHRHLGVHTLVTAAEIPGEFADYATPRPGSISLEYIVAERAVLDALPDGFLPAVPARVLLAVGDEIGGTGQSGLRLFRDWAKYFDAYVLSLVKAEPPEPPEYNGPDPAALGAEVCRSLMTELAQHRILLETPVPGELLQRAWEATPGWDTARREWCAVLIPLLDMVSVRAHLCSRFGFHDLAVLSPGDGEFSKYIFVRYPADPADITGPAFRERLGAAVLKAAETAAMLQATPWRLQGYDTFSMEDYGLDGEYRDQEAAELAGQERLAELERTQPSASSGGQGGIQDRVYVVRPDGSTYRLWPRRPAAGIPDRAS
jgi:hypothetical protein